MGLLQEFENEQAHLKAGFLGFAGTGKTYTAADLAIGVREHFKLKGPIAFFDTETGSSYVGKRIHERTGVKPVRRMSRSLADLIAVTKECVSAGVSVLLADSMTHVWREVCSSALAEINEARRRFAEDKNYRFKPLKKLEFQHWGPVKDKWAEFTDLFLTSELHIIICGRAGYEYDFEEDNEGKKELVKTGVRMKTEGEFGFEPSLLIEMTREWVDGEQVRRATVLKDRFDVIDGKVFNNPTFKSFMPHIELLTPGAGAPMDTEARTKLGLDTDGSDDWRREKQARTVLCEEIQGLMVERYPGQTQEHKTAKTKLLQHVFGTRSWSNVESMTSEKLRAGLNTIRAELNTIRAEFTDAAAATAPAQTEEQRAADWEREQAKLADGAES